MGDKVPGGTDKKPKKEKTDSPKDKKEAPKADKAAPAPKKKWTLNLIYKLNLIYINMNTKFRYNLWK